MLLDPKLRKIKKHLQKDYNIPDFVFTKKLSKTISSYEEGIAFIQLFCIQNNFSCKKEDFEYMVDLYGRNKELFKELCNYTRYSKNYCEQLIEVYGEDFLYANLNIIPDLDKYKNIKKEYIDILKQNVDKIDVFDKIISLGDNKAEFLLKYINLSNIGEIIEVTKNINSDMIMNFLFDNIEDKEVVLFVKNLINNNVDIELSYNFGYKKYLKMLNQCTEKTEIIKKFNIYLVQNLKKENSKKLMLSALTTLIRPDDYIYSINDLLEQGIKIDNNGEKALIANEIVENYDNSFNDFIDHYMKEDLYVDYHEAYKYISEINEQLINNHLSDIDSFASVSPIDYSYLDAEGNKIEKKINVKIIDDLNFDILIHSITDKTKDPIGLQNGTNYSLAPKLIQSPELWTKIAPSEANDELSTSYFHGYYRPFGVPLVCLGFKSIPKDSLELMKVNDAGTSMKRNHLKTQVYPYEFFPFVSFNRITNPRGNNSLTRIDYNEVLLTRYPNGECITPDYIIISKDELTTKQMEYSKKWAAYYDIPIVIIDLEKIIEKRKANIIKIVNDIINKQDIDYDDVNDIVHEIYMASCNYNYKIDLKYIINIIKQIYDNLSLNAETADLMIDLMTGLIPKQDLKNEELAYIYEACKSKSNHTK